MCLGVAYEAGHVQQWDLHRGYQIQYVSKGSKKIDMRSLRSRVNNWEKENRAYYSHHETTMQEEQLSGNRNDRQQCSKSNSANSSTRQMWVVHLRNPSSHFMPAQQGSQATTCLARDQTWDIAIFVVRFLLMEMAMPVADGAGLCSSKNEITKGVIAVQSSAALNSRQEQDPRQKHSKRCKTISINQPSMYV